MTKDKARAASVEIILDLGTPARRMPKRAEECG